MAPVLRARPYKDFLTPLLHRRFAKATAILGFSCYAVSLCIGEWNSYFWSWFPLGRAGIRAALLFIPAFMIFILRVGQLHVGLRTSFSAWQTFRTFPKFQVIQTLIWYLLSAYIFSEVYIWSASKDADLGRIKYVPKTDRPLLNEKPIYLTSYLFILAAVQAGFHLWRDYDRIDTLGTKSGEGASSTQDSHVSLPAFDRLQSQIFSLVVSSGQRVGCVAIIAPLVYSVPFYIYPYSIRSFAWGLTRSWAKLFYSLPKTTSPPTVGPFHYNLLLRTVTSGFMLVMLWELGNAAFSAYVAQEPLKNERPITFESRDPNGSLLTGLKGQKIQTRAFAFWELVYISQRYEGRRKAIFEDIDRNGGSMWSQILAICLETIGEIEKRINEYENPTPPMVDASSIPANDNVNSLPRLTPPLKPGLGDSDDLFSSPSRKATGFEAKLFTRDKASANNLSPRAKQLAVKAESALLTQEQRQTVTSEGVVGLFREPFARFLRFPVGVFFRQEYRRKMAAVVLGEPFGDVGIIVDAVDSLTRFAVCSLKEDKYGNVQRDVKVIIRTFTTVVTKLEQFRDNVGFHWTDVEQKRESPEVETILSALKGGLDELVEAFGDYSEDLRLSQSELRMAREAAAIPARSKPEMGEKGR